MKITNNSFYSYRSNNDNQKSLGFTGYKQTLQKSIDKFVSSDSHTKDEEEAFISLLSKNMPKILKDKNYIGEGLENFIYKISQKYLLKLPKHYVLRNDSLPKSATVSPDYFSTVENYFGNPIIELFDVKVLRNLGKNMPIGAKNSKNLQATINELEDYYLKTYLPKVASIPQKSYDELAKNFDKFNEIKFPSGSYAQFDSLNPNNTVIRNNKFYFVDDINQVRESYTNSAAKLLNMFLERMTAVSSAPITGDSFKFARIVFKKILMAAQKENLILAGDRQDADFLKLVLKQCKIDEKQGLECISKLDSLCSNKNEEERLRLSEELIDNLLKNN